MARFTESDAPANPAQLGQKIIDALNGPLAKSVELLAVPQGGGMSVVLRIWDGVRDDDSNSEDSSSDFDY